MPGNNQSQPDLILTVAYRERLKKILREKELIERDELITIRDHIARYAPKVSGNFAVAQIRATHHYLVTYTAIWNKHYYNTQEPVLVPELIIEISKSESTALMKTEPVDPTPKEKWSLTKKDRDFLRSLRIDPEVGTTEDNEKI